MGATFGKQLYTEPYWDVIAVSGVTGVALGLMASSSKEVILKATLAKYLILGNDEHHSKTSNFPEYIIERLLE